MNMELISKYGQPSHWDEKDAIALLQLRDVHPSDVYASRYPSREAAEAFQAANLEHHGHPSLGITREPAGDGWIGVLDMRPALARAREQARAGRSRAYPYEEGDILVLGPEVFASASRETICWRGVNYRRDAGSLEPGGTDHDEHDGET